jgi:hypothetical protein
MARPVIFDEANTTYRGDGKEIRDLHCHVDGDVTTAKWELTDEEIAFIVQHRCIFVAQMNFKQPLQPQLVMAQYPFESPSNLDS